MELRRPQTPPRLVLEGALVTSEKGEVFHCEDDDGGVAFARGRRQTEKQVQWPFLDSVQASSVAELGQDVYEPDLVEELKLLLDYASDLVDLLEYVHSAAAGVHRRRVGVRVRVGIGVGTEVLIQQIHFVDKSVFTQMFVVTLQTSDLFDSIFLSTLLNGFRVQPSEFGRRLSGNSDHTLRRLPLLLLRRVLFLLNTNVQRLQVGILSPCCDLVSQRPVRVELHRRQLTFLLHVVRSLSSPLHILFEYWTHCRCQWMLRFLRFGKCLRHTRTMVRCLACSLDGTVHLQYFFQSSLGDPCLDYNCSCSYFQGHYVCDLETTGLSKRVSLQGLLVSLGVSLLGVAILAMQKCMANFGRQRLQINGKLLLQVALHRRSGSGVVELNLSSTHSGSVFEVTEPLSLLLGTLGELLEGIKQQSLATDRFCFLGLSVHKTILLLTKIVTLQSSLFYTLLQRADLLLMGANHDIDLLVLIRFVLHSLHFGLLLLVGDLDDGLFEYRDSSLSVPHYLGVIGRCNQIGKQLLLQLLRPCSTDVDFRAQNHDLAFVPADYLRYTSLGGLSLLIKSIPKLLFIPRLGQQGMGHSVRVVKQRLLHVSQQTVPQFDNHLLELFYVFFLADLFQCIQDILFLGTFLIHITLDLELVQESFQNLLCLCWLPVQADEPIIQDLIQYLSKFLPACT